MTDTEFVESFEETDDIDMDVDTDIQEEIEDVDLDEIADTAIEVLQTLLKPFDIGDITIDEYESDDGALILDITGDDLGILIGRYGRTLNALQFIVSAIVHKRLDYYYPVIIDVEGYKSRQREKIEDIAVRMANKAASQNKSIDLKPMNSYERRIVHTILSDDSRVNTRSKGNGDDRHVVIYPNK